MTRKLLIFDLDETLVHASRCHLRRSRTSFAAHILSTSDRICTHY